jgi:hypothetical protein
MCTAMYTTMGIYVLKRNTYIFIVFRDRTENLLGLRKYRYFRYLTNHDGNHKTFSQE